jgi:hypothetical protein
LPNGIMDDVGEGVIDFETPQLQLLETPIPKSHGRADRRNRPGRYTRELLNEIL